MTHRSDTVKQEVVHPVRARKDGCGVELRVLGQRRGSVSLEAVQHGRQPGGHLERPARRQHDLRAKDDGGHADDVDADVDGIGVVGAAAKEA